MLKFENNSLNIVAYHYVREIKKSNYPNLKGVEFNLFKRQLKFFKKNFYLLPVDEMIEILNKKKTLNYKKPLMMLTFDDGYKDHYKYVFQELVKHKIDGCFYPPINIFKKKILNVNKVQFILSVSKNKKKLLREIKYLLEKYNVNLKNKSENLHNSKIPEFDDPYTLKIKKIIYKDIKSELSDKICTILFKKYIGEDIKNFSRKLYISKKDIIEMSNNNMHIGSHGVNHLMWSKISSKEQQCQIIESKKFFNKISINTNNFSICYPWGSYLKNREKLLSKLNIKFGLTSDNGNIIFKRGFNKFFLPRLDANEFNNI